MQRSLNILILDLGPEDSGILARMGYFDYVERPKAIKPHQGKLDADWTP